MIEVAQQVLEVHQQIAGRLVSAVNLFRQELERDAFQLRWNVVMETGDGLGLFVDHIVQDFTQVGPGKRRAAREQKVDDGAQTEEVAAVIDGLADRLFGAHVPRGSEDMPLLRLLLRPPSFPDVSADSCNIRLARPKSRTLTSPRSFKLIFSGLMSRWTIRRRVGGIERVGDLNGDRHDPGNLQRSLLHEVTRATGLPRTPWR